MAQPKNGRQPRGSQQVLVILAPCEATDEARERAAKEAAQILRGGHVQLTRPRGGRR